MNVMDSMRGTQEMIVQGESSVNERHRTAGLRGRGRAGPDYYDQVGASVPALQSWTTAPFQTLSS